MEEGADLREIMGQIRHTTIKLTVDTYTHMRPATSRKNASRIDAAFGDLGREDDEEPIPPALLPN
jgi:hypothetical protein